MKKFLAVCNTPLQLICVINIKNKVFPNDLFDVIVSDHMSEGFLYFKNIIKYEIFNNIYFVKSFEYCRLELPHPNGNMLNKILFYQNIKKIYGDNLKEFVSINEKYDVFLFCNMDTFARLLYEKLRNDNRKIEAYLFEDGYSSYYAQGVYWKSIYDDQTSLKTRIKNKIFGIHSLVPNIKGQYLYRPDESRWKAPFERLKIPKVDMLDSNLVSELNCVFGYEKSENEYKEPVIFFEESFRREGMDIGDVQLVEKISDIIGKENILIKPHPRSIDNVYKKMGYRTIESVGVPWEVIIMNHPELSEKILVSVCSGAIATPYTMFGMRTNSVVLMDLLNIKMEGFYKTYFEYMKNVIFLSSPDVFVIPQNIQDLNNYFEEWQKSRKEC